MATPPLVTYWRRQSGPLCLLLYALGATFLLLGWNVGHEPAVSLVLLLAGLVNLFLALAFHHLTVADEGDALALRFGPLPLLRTAIRYDDIRRVDLGRTTLLEGLGLHFGVRGGRVWTIWGRDCVELELRSGSTFRIGTDDAENLASFVQTRIEDFDCRRRK